MMKSRRRFLGESAALGGISTPSIDAAMKRRESLLSHADQTNPPEGLSSNSLRIKDTTIHLLREPVGLRRHYAVLCLETLEGIQGVGEIGLNVDNREEVQSALPRLREALVGKDASMIEAQWLELRKSRFSAPVRAAINMALWDIYGKSLNAPVYRFSGGPTRKKVRVYAEIEDDGNDHVISAAQILLRTDVRAIRIILLGLSELEDGPRRVEVALKRIAKFRSEFGDEVDLIADCRRTLSAAEAAVLARDLESQHVLWLSDPSDSRDPELYLKLSNETVTPLGIGHSIENATEAMEFLRRGAVDVIETSLAAGAGLSGLRRIANAAEAHYVAIAPRACDGPVATAAGLQLAAMVSNFYILGMRIPLEEANQKMRLELHQSSLERIEKGYVALPTKPGLGIELNQSGLEKYRV
jgi:galactonate dehydratase